MRERRYEREVTLNGERVRIRIVEWHQHEPGVPSRAGDALALFSRWSNWGGGRWKSSDITNRAITPSDIPELVEALQNVYEDWNRGETALAIAAEELER